MKRIGRKWRILLTLWLLYLAPYFFLTLTGGYEIGKSGRVFVYGLLPTHDIYLWQLRFGIDSPFHGRVSVFSAIYAPLLWLDRKWWHKQKPMLEIDEAGEIVYSPRPPDRLLHPRMLKARPIIEKYNKAMEKAELTETFEDDDLAYEVFAKEMESIY